MPFNNILIYRLQLHMSRARKSFFRTFFAYLFDAYQYILSFAVSNYTISTSVNSTARSLIRSQFQPTAISTYHAFTYLLSESTALLMKIFIVKSDAVKSFPATNNNRSHYESSFLLGMASLYKWRGRLNCNHSRCQVQETLELNTCNFKP